MSDGGGRATLLDWVKGLGLPVASFIASIAFFGIQMQQQAFERKLNNIENGYRSYFEKRTSLQSSADVNTETTLLQLLGSAFPNVYCNIRADMYARATAAEVAPDGTDGAFTEADRRYMISFLVANRTPQRGEFSTDLVSLLRSRQERDPQPCTSSFDAERDVVAPAPAEAAIAETAPAPGEAGSGSGATTSAPSGTVVAEAPVLRPDVRARIGVRSDAAREIVERAYVPRAQTYQVFFHIREGSTRTRESINPLRAPLAEANFRVMRGVEVVAASSFPGRPQVRYFGPDQEAAANELVAALNAQYESEGLTFQAQAIGAQYPNMPPSHLEVWVP